MTLRMRLRVAALFQSLFVILQAGGLLFIALGIVSVSLTVRYTSEQLRTTPNNDGVETNVGVEPPPHMAPCACTLSNRWHHCRSARTRHDSAVSGLAPLHLQALVRAGLKLPN